MKRKEKRADRRDRDSSEKKKERIEAGKKE